MAIDVEKLSPEQLKKLAAELKKGSSNDRAPYEKVKKDLKQLANGGKLLADLTKENPQI